MTRIARVVVPDLPHVAQRGNRREPVFYYRLYRRLVAAAAQRPLPEAHRTGAIPGPSTLASGGRAICSRTALGRW